MVPPKPTETALARLARIKAPRRGDNDYFDSYEATEALHNLWRVVYEEGSEIPADVAMTDK
jgi:hypothetical protein